MSVTTSSDAEQQRRAQCVSDGRRTFLKMSAVGLAALGLNALTARKELFNCVRSINDAAL